MSIKPNIYYSSREEMLRFIPQNAKKILDVGCGEGRFGHLLKSQRSAEVWGIELDNSAAEKADKILDKVIVGNIEDDNLLLPEKYFDCIVFNDILEHLRYPWIVLKKVLRNIKLDGYVVASIPNIRHYENMKRLLLHKEWEYTDMGIMDKTHLRFFTEKSIRNMFERCGSHIVTLEGINGSTFSWKLGLFNKLVFNSLDDMRYIQFACVAQKKE